MKTKPAPFRRFKAEHSPAVKLAVYYAAFFGLLCMGLFWMANQSLEHTIQKKQLKAVKNKALEYKAWYTKGDLQQLESRMSEQTLQAGDTLFVHIFGDTYDYINFTKDTAIEFPQGELDALDQMVSGNNIPMGDYDWTIHSVPIEGTNLVLQAGKHSQAVQNTLADFKKTSLLFLIPGAIIAIIGGVLLAYRFLAPTRQLVSTMEGILESGDLSQRALTMYKGNELNKMVELFNRLLGENQRLIQVMQDSLDHIAHDLRTPLTRIRITSERALTNSSKSSPSELQTALSDCAEEVDYIERLLTVLMNVAEAQSGAITLKKEPIVAYSLLEDVLELYEFVAEDKEIKFAIDCPDSLSLEADRTRLAQVLANLVDNAIKYSPQHSTISISCQEAGDAVEIKVTDQGIGISAEDLPHIWNRLYRADRSRTEKGMGLGLSLVKAITETHGGEIEVTSQLNKGSEFKITLPSHKQR